MKILEVLKRFTDTDANVKREVGQRFEVTDERAEQLLVNPYNIVRELSARELEPIEPQPEYDLTPPQMTEKGFNEQQLEVKIVDDPVPNEPMAIPGGDPQPTPAVTVSSVIKKRGSNGKPKRKLTNGKK